jgi:hypothetical protein
MCKFKMFFSETMFDLAELDHGFHLEKLQIYGTGDIGGGAQIHGRSVPTQVYKERS